MSTDYGTLSLDLTIALPQTAEVAIAALREAYLPRGTATPSGGHIWEGHGRAAPSQGGYERGPVTIRVEGDGAGSVYTVNHSFPLENGWGIDLPYDLPMAMSETADNWISELAKVPGLVSEISATEPGETPQPQAILTYHDVVPYDGDLDDALAALRDSRLEVPHPLIVLGNPLASLERDGAAFRAPLEQQGTGHLPDSDGSLTVTPRHRGRQHSLELTVTADLGAVPASERAFAAYAVAWGAANARLQMGRALASLGRTALS